MDFYEHFDVGERTCLQVFLQDGNSLREIAKLLNRNVSSISRELQRNSNKDGSYNFWRATSLYLYIRKKSVCKLLLKFKDYFVFSSQKDIIFMR